MQHNLKLKKNTKSFILACLVSTLEKLVTSARQVHGWLPLFCGGMGTTTTTLVTIQSHIGNNTFGIALHLHITRGNSILSFVKVLQRHNSILSFVKDLQRHNSILSFVKDLQRHLGFRKVLQRHNSILSFVQDLAKASRCAQSLLCSRTHYLPLPSMIPL
jgi:hypothetical protein